MAACCPIQAIYLLRNTLLWPRSACRISRTIYLYLLCISFLHNISLTAQHCCRMLCSRCQYFPNFKDSKFAGDTAAVVPTTGAVAVAAEVEVDRVAITSMVDTEEVPRAGTEGHLAAPVQGLVPMEEHLVAMAAMEEATANLVCPLFLEVASMAPTEGRGEDDDGRR